MDVGNRLREVRQKASLSQRELAKRAGVTNSTISMIEKNNVSPSVSSLKKVLDGIPMSLMEFFEADNEAVAPTQVKYLPEDFQDTFLNDIQFRLIGKGFPNRTMAFMVEVYPPGADTGGDMYLHEGEEGGYVLRGKLELIVEDESHIIEQGQAYYIDTTKPHRFRNPFDEECELVSAATPADF